MDRIYHWLAITGLGIPALGYRILKRPRPDLIFRQPGGVPFSSD